MKKLVLAAALLAGPMIAFAAAAPPDAWQPVRFMIGDWAGEASGAPGTGRVERQYALILGGRFIEERNISIYEARGGKPREVHEHRAFFSYDRARKTLMLRQFHAESFVNLYAMNAAQSTASKLVFESVEFENLSRDWQARETYEIVSPDEFIEIFELKEPGKPDFEVYSRNHFKRKAAATRAPPPTRPIDGPLAPKWTVITGAGRNALPAGHRARGIRHAGSRQPEDADRENA